MKNKTITLISLLALSISTLSFSISSHAEIYKWTDAKGQVHYSARPPVQKQENTQEIEEKILMSVGKFDPSSVKNKNKTNEGTPEDEVSAENKETKSKPTKQLVDYCKAQRKSLKLLKNNQNIMWEQFGKKTSLTAAQRKAKMKKIKSEITEECKGV